MTAPNPRSVSQPDASASRAYATDRERVLTETLIEARDQLVALADEVRAFDAMPVVYAFEPIATPTDDAWALWDALMLDAQDLGEGQVMVREARLLHVAWRTSPSAPSAADQ